MTPFGKLTNAGLSIKRTLFRRDAERSFYTGSPFPLPKIDKITGINADLFRKTYPFSFCHNQTDYDECRRIFREMSDTRTVLQNAEKAKQRVFDFPSGPGVSIGLPVKWNMDYISGYNWPETLSWKQDFFNIPVGADLYNPWLMGRLNQLIHLGKGYLITGDESFTSEYISLIKEFNEKNPFCAGVNWLSTGEVSIRLLNLIFALPLVLYSELINDSFFNSFLETVLFHSVFIENNLLPDGNDYEYVISLTALGTAGAVLKDSFYGKKLLYLCSSKIEEAVWRLLTPEGLSKIRSVPLHSQITEAFFIAHMALMKSGIKVSQVFEERYAKLFDVLASLLRDDGSVAQIGEPIIRRILPYSDGEQKFPLAYGAFEFKKGKYREFITEPTEDILFYFGKDAVKEYKEIKIEPYAKISYGYTKSGIFILRNDDIHVTVDAEPVASNKKWTAGHNDILSYELYYKGYKLIIDPGMHTVYADPGAREALKSVKSHNTIYIDNEEPVQFEGVYGLKEDLSSTKVTEWHSDEYEDILSVQHYAYAGFADPVIIKRIFRLLKEKNKFIIRTEIFGGSTHQAAANMIFHPDVNIVPGENNIFRITAPVEAEVIISSPVSLITTSIQDNVYSPAYGKLESTKKIIIALTAQFPVYLTTEIQLK